MLCLHFVLVLVLVLFDSAALLVDCVVLHFNSIYLLYSVVTCRVVSCQMRLSAVVPCRVVLAPPSVGGVAHRIQYSKHRVLPAAGSLCRFVSLPCERRETVTNGLALRARSESKSRLMIRSSLLPVRT